MKKQVLPLALLSILIVSCASPQVVDVNQAGDKSLLCSQINEEIKQADSFEKKAREERKVTGKNVAAAILFWPALLGTYSNTEEAINAAKERKMVLLGLHNQKGCN